MLLVMWAGLSLGREWNVIRNVWERTARQRFARGDQRCTHLCCRWLQRLAVLNPRRCKHSWDPIIGPRRFGTRETTSPPCLLGSSRRPWHLCIVSSLPAVLALVLVNSFYERLFYYCLIMVSNCILQVAAQQVGMLRNHMSMLYVSQQRFPFSSGYYNSYSFQEPQQSYISCSLQLLLMAKKSFIASLYRRGWSLLMRC